MEEKGNEPEELPEVSDKPTAAEAEVLCDPTSTALALPTSVTDSDPVGKGVKPSMEELNSFFQSLLGLHSSQQGTAITCCEEQLIFTVEDLRLVASDLEDLNELFPQVEMRARVQEWFQKERGDKGEDAQVNGIATTLQAAAEAQPVTRTTSVSAPTKESRPKRQTRSSQELLDVCAQMDFKEGDRLEVEWEMRDESYQWFGCTLLPHDGRTLNGVAIRVLEYRGGSQQFVVFLGPGAMISADAQRMQFRFRREEQRILYRTEGEVRSAIHQMLMSTFRKHAAKWSQLEEAQQSAIAAGIVQKKELLVAAIMKHSKSTTLGVDDMKELLQGAMQKSVI